MERSNIEGLICNHLCEITNDVRFIVGHKCIIKVKTNTWVKYSNVIDTLVEISIAKKIKED